MVDLSFVLGWQWIQQHFHMVQQSIFTLARRCFGTDIWGMRKFEEQFHCFDGENFLVLLLLLFGLMPFCYKEKQVYWRSFCLDVNELVTSAQFRIFMFLLWRPRIKGTTSFWITSLKCIAGSDNRASWFVCLCACVCFWMFRRRQEKKGSNSEKVCQCTWANRQVMLIRRGGL